MKAVDLRPRHLRRAARAACAVASVAAVMLGAGPARAQLGYGFHAEGAAARMVGEPKSSQFGWGGAGLVSPELTVAGRVGFEAALGAVGLSDGQLDEAGLAPTGAGAAFLLLPGVRVRPFGRADDPGIAEADGLWLGGGGGLAVTGGASRPALDARVGYDLHGGPLLVGPFAGYVHIVEPDDSVRPADGRVVLFGIHVAFASPGPTAAPAPESTEPERRVASTPPAPTRARDADGEAEVELDDLCPGDEETVNGYADTDGCPDEREVRVVGSEIVLDERVHFAVNGAAVEVRSWPLLARVGRLLRDNPQYALVRIQGHADDTGEEDYNQRLSVARGQSVRELIVRTGVSDARLVVEGFGETRPEAEGRTELARRKNRRVELHILERSEAGHE
ncbi:MAG: OmpA family protein [Polyangiaceae bacterium]|nr:OmpA family protein [Polyangiaceae bacterium]